MQYYQFEAVGKENGLEMKAQQTIVDPWPARFGMGVATPAAIKDFEMRLGHSHVGEERFVEWRVAREETFD